LPQHKAEGGTPAASSDVRGNLPAAAEGPFAAPAGPVQMAQMVNKAAQSEMRIGMSTNEFGSVEVRTVVHAGDVGVLIGSEKGDLRSLLANELPGIANTLQQQNLRLNQVNFHQSFAFSNPMSSGGDSQPRQFHARNFSALSPLPESNGHEMGEAAEVQSIGAAGGISILA
jgi:flagellar hook-length control protein FliK